MEKQSDVNKPLLPPTLPRWWRVLPFLILLMIIFNIDGLILNDLIEYRFATQYQVNSSSTQNARELCLNSTRTSSNSSHFPSTTPSQYSTTSTMSPNDHVQASTAQLNVYISLASTIPAVITATLLGANCDRIGRKPLIILPYVGKIIRYVILTVVVGYDLSDLWIILSVMLDSLFGTGALNILSAFAYVSDCTNERTRTLATTITDVSIGGSRFIPLLTMGLYLQQPRFMQVMVFTLLLSIVGFVTGIVLQPESNLSVQHLNIFQQLKLVRFQPVIDAFRVFFIKREGHKQRSMLILVVIHLCICAMVCGHLAMFYIYVYGAPFCLDSFGASLNTVAQSVSAILLTVLFALSVKKRSDHLVLPAIAILIYMTQLILFGVATQVWMLYLAVCISAIYSVLGPVVRSRITKLIEPSEYAMVFIPAMILQSGGYYAISAMTNAIYQASITSMPGLVYYVVAMFGVVGLLLILILYILEYKPARRQMDISLND